MNVKHNNNEASNKDDDVPEMNNFHSDKLDEIGRGRSGVVYRVRNSSGVDIACKVFDSQGLTKFIQLLTLGAPNPYMWNTDAVQCAKIRRNILSLLVPMWTDDQIGVADAESMAWSEQSRSFELHTHFVGGRPAALQHSLRESSDDEAGTLWRETMPRLRGLLQQAGFDGLMWQAGAGNPVALNNFLLENDPEVANDATGPDNARWIWIDLESGVPAIFPISPKVLFTYSLRLCWRYRRFMFDDVDCERLQDYLRSDAELIREELGTDTHAILLRQAASLDEHQRKWKAVGRIESSIRYRLMRGHIDEAQADFYLQHKIRWLLRESLRGFSRSFSLVGRAMKYLFGRIRNLRLLSKISNGLLLLVSRRRRDELVHNYLDGRIFYWLGRRQMSHLHAEQLQAQIGAPESSVYIADFGMHLAIKPAVKGLQYLALPGLLALGVISGPLTAFLIVAGGALARTAYTLTRVVQPPGAGRSRPWIALAVGLFPVIGNLAFPTQMMFSVRSEKEILARFMLDDGFARIGRMFPIWGGEDTWTEHVFSRLPGKTLEYLAGKFRRDPASSTT